MAHDSKGLPVDDRGWPIMEVVDYDPAAKRAKREIQNQRAAEHERLKEAVVNQAKQWFLNTPFSSDTALANTIETLIEFESKCPKEGV